MQEHAEHPEADAGEHAGPASQAIRGASTVVVTHVKFWQPDCGAATRIQRLLAALREAGLKMHLAYVGYLSKEEEKTITAQGFESVTFFVPRRREIYCRIRDHLPMWVRKAVQGVRTLRWYLSGMPGRQPMGLDDFRDAMVVEGLSQLCREVQPQIVLVEYLSWGYVLEAVGPEPVTVVDTHDVMHVRRETFVTRGLPHWLNITRDEEIRSLQRFDVIVAIQQNDAKTFREMVPGKTVVTCRPCFAPRDRSAAAPDQKADSKRVLCVGAALLPNRQGLEAFLKDAWPDILAEHPDAELIVCGNLCAWFRKRQPNTQFRGFVEDLNQEYASADIVISPVPFGGGIKIKCLEALAKGKACVVSEHSVIGIEDGADSAFLVAKTAGEFAQHINRLLANPTELHQLADAAAAYAESRLSPQQTTAELIQALANKLQERRTGAEEPQQ